ncbi:MAG: HEPN domain-containing protein, partial [bacterium]
MGTEQVLQDLILSGNSTRQRAIMLEKKVIDLSAHRLKKAKSLLKQAEFLLNNQMYDGSINRSYYAIFNAIRSLLSLIKLESKKHSGTLSLFDLYFVKTAIFEKRFSEIAHTAFGSRQDFDYEDFSIPSETEA